jgi:hypothetical protein
LNERFGIYTVYLGRQPETDEVDPYTGEYFTKYQQGVAYQAAIRARNSGILKRNPEDLRKAIDAGKLASQNRRDAFVPQPKTMGEARKQDSFGYRTSVRGSSGYGQTTTELVAVEDDKGNMRSERREVSPDRQMSTPNGMRSVRHPDEEEPLAEPPSRGQKIIRPDW